MYKYLPVVLLFIFFSCSKTLEEKKAEVEKEFPEALSLYNNGNFDKAESLLEDLLKLEKEIGRHNYLAHIQLYLGLINFQHSKYYNALDYYKNALSEYEILRDQENQVVVLANMGGIYVYLNQYDKAIETSYKSYDLSRIIVDKESQSIALSNIASAYDGLENYERAMEFYNRAIIMNKINDDYVGVATNTNNIGELFLHQGKYDTSIKYFNDALILAQKVRDVNLEGIILKNIGNYCIYKDKNEEALNLYVQSILKARLAPNSDLERESLNNLGEIFYKTYQYDKAKYAFEEALAIARGKKDRFSEGFFLNSIGNTYKLLFTAGDKDALEKAEKQYEEALSIFNEIHYELGISSVYFNLANVYELKNLKDKALETYKKAVELRENLIEPPHNSFLFKLLKTEEVNYYQVANLLLETGKNEEALAYIQKQASIAYSDSLRKRSTKLSDYSMESLRNNYLNLKNEVAALYYSYIFELSKPKKDADDTKIKSLKELIESRKNDLTNMKNNLLSKNEIFKYIAGSPVLSLKEIQSKINSGSLIIQYFSYNNFMYIISITKNTFNIDKISIPSGVLESQKKMYIDALNIKSKSKQSAPPVDPELNATLYNYFIKPIEGIKNNYQNIIIITNDPSDKQIYNNFYNDKKPVFLNSYLELKP
jgi:tetratricopeptide (TPR) repeat protein